MRNPFAKHAGNWSGGPIDRREDDSKGNGFVMKYTVKRIDEDLDFGCEERSADAPVMAVVTLVDEAGQEVRMRQPDQMLYDKDINEGDTVILNEKQESDHGQESNGSG